MDFLHPGKVIGVRVGPIIHVGIVSDKLYFGEPMVISNSNRAGGVAEEPLGVFQGPYKLIPMGQPAEAPREQVLARARKKIGTTWNLFSWNCEHFIRHAYGVKPESSQLQNAFVVAGAFWLLTRLAKSA